jgi:hypothetical protein
MGEGGRMQFLHFHREKLVLVNSLGEWLFTAKRWTRFYLYNKYVSHTVTTLLQPKSELT